MLTKTLSVLTILAIFNCEAFQQSDTGDEVYDAERQGRASNCGKIDPTRYKEMPKWTRKADNAYDDHGETLHNINSGWFLIESYLQEGLVLQSVPHGKTPVVMYRSDSDLELQLWRFDGEQVVANNNGMVLDNSGGEVVMWDRHGGANQQFKFQDNELVSVRDNTTLDVEGGNKEPGTQVLMYERKGAQNQKWRQIYHVQVQPPACFEMTDNIPKEIRANVEAVRKAIEDHEEIKMEVTDALLELSRNVEGIVVQKTEEEMDIVWDRIEGHSIIVGVGTASLIMLATPLAPLSAPVGIAGAVIGYLSLGGSEVHAIYVRSKHVERIEKIQDDLFKELKKYTDSQEKVFETLNIKMEILTEGKEVKKNLKRIRKIVEEIEDESNVSFKEVFLFIEKAKAKYMSLSPEQKESLNINDFVVKAQELTSKVAPLVAGVTSKVVAEGRALTKRGAIGAIGAGMHVASGFTFFNFLQGINILIHGVFAVNDIRKYNELRRMIRETWSVEKIFKESKEFKKEEELRNFIVKIRDEIVKGF